MVSAGVYLRCVFADAGMVFADPMIGSANVHVAVGHAALAALSFTGLSRLLRWGSRLLLLLLCLRRRRGLLLQLFLLLESRLKALEMPMSC